MGIILALLIANGIVPPGSGRPALGGAVRAHGDRRSARSSADGGSSTRWARRSRSSSRLGGMAAETAAAVTILFDTSRGIPVSTTHTITGRDRRRRDDPASLGGPVGGRRPGRVGVGAHDPGVVRDQLPRLPPVQGGRHEDRSAPPLLRGARRDLPGDARADAGRVPVGEPVRGRARAASGP